MAPFPPPPPFFSLGRRRSWVVTTVTDTPVCDAVPPSGRSHWHKWFLPDPQVCGGRGELTCGARAPGSLPSSAPDKTGDWGRSPRPSSVAPSQAPRDTSGHGTRSPGVLAGGIWVHSCQALSRACHVEELRVSLCGHGHGHYRSEGVRTDTLHGHDPVRHLRGVNQRPRPRHSDRRLGDSAVTDSRRRSNHLTDFLFISLDQSHRASAYSSFLSAVSSDCWQ